ncbi:MAG: BlaI/MecI/CopY family transcriptional regulator [Planctomycetota bacterium]
MSGRADERLSGLQLGVLRALWSAGEATVQGVRDSLADERPLAPTTVATLLKRLEARGLVTHRREGRQFVYRATETARDVESSMVAGLVRDVFGGRTEDLFAHLLTSDEVTDEELERVRRMIEERAGRESESHDPGDRPASG